MTRPQEDTADESLTAPSQEAPVRRCPPLVFIRMLDDIREFVIERAAPGGEGTVLAFYHRQVSVAI